MSITTRSPLREIESLRERIDKVFSELPTMPRLTAGLDSLAIDLQETDKDIIVKASLPGIKPDDLVVEINKGVLTIRGESKDEREETNGTWHLQERRSGSVYRSVTLPSPVYEDEVKAVLEDGVLTVTAPKSDQAPARRVEVQSR